MVSRFIEKHLMSVIAIALYVASLGGMYATVKADLNYNALRIKQLEEIRSDETRWTTQQHEKRLDNHDAFLLRINDQLGKIAATLERIDQRTGGNGTAGK